MRVNVTQRDIDKGHPVMATLCPIARSLHRHATMRDAAVSTRMIYDPSVGYIDLPKSAKKFVEMFDNGEPVKPFSFRINTNVVN